MHVMVDLNKSDSVDYLTHYHGEICHRQIIPESIIME